MMLILYLLPPALLLIADAAGWVDLSARPLTRVLKWGCAAWVAWFLPIVAQNVFHLQIDENHLNFWKLFILGSLGFGLLSVTLKWFWRSYGPAPEGHRRCPKCRQPVMKVMLECPHCRNSL